MQTKLDSIIEAVVQTLISFSLLLMAESVVIAILYAVVLATKSYVIRRLFHYKSIRLKGGKANDK